MHQSVLLFLAPSPARAISEKSPPAPAGAAAKRSMHRETSIRFAARVLGNAVGFAALFAGCWFSLRLLQALL